MDLIAPAVAQHLTALVPPRPKELADMEVEAARTGFPIIGPAAGHFCYLLARAIGARRVFELGSGFGYSTAWFARAVAENGGGEVHHVVWDADLSRRARKHLENLGLVEHVRFHVGEAVETLHYEAGPFDLVFNDIDKEGYPASLDVIAERLRPGGLLIVDNALWHGRPFDPADRSPATEGVRELTRRLTTDARWITSLAPIRDGLLLALRTEA
jgi:predicted O-methyltransferase YrrM